VFSLANAGSNKRDIARAKQEKAALKRSRRQHSDTDAAECAVAGQPSASVPATSERDVIAALDSLHRRFAVGGIGFDEFETRKTELLDRLAR
jgi:hypothetical protein